MTTLLIATRNAHKVQEIRQILGETFRYLTLNDFPGAPVVSEDATSFEGNAKKKALSLAQWLSAYPQRLFDKVAGTETPFYILADDSGLEVDALDDAPGVHSARFAAMDVGGAGNSPDAANNAKLRRLLEKMPAEKRGARFRCVLALTRVLYGIATKKVLLPSKQQTIFFEGACEGRIAFAPSGPGGFGYDPLFIPTGYEQSFAELGEEIKNKFSHRARALEKLKQHLQKKSAK